MPVALGGLKPLDPRPCLVVTRPAEQAQAWVADLAAHGVRAIALPLIETVSPSNDHDLRHWRAHWSTADALMFVSGAAVRAFFDAAPTVVSDANTRFWAPGPGTANALAQVLPAWGVAPTQIDAPAHEAEQFDSEALWAVVQSQVGLGCTVVIVGGGAGREWLTQRCQEAGATVHRCEAYTRQAPEPSIEWLVQLALARQAACVWLFSSAQALEHLALLVPQADWSDRTALVTHPRIAVAARALGFERVYLSRPTVADVLKTLESQDHER